MSAITALDLFAGTGWGVACQWLGIEEHGVELMDEAVATRTAAGMSTVYRDVWDGLADPTLVPKHDLLIASPPCQTFSMAGGGSGRRALDEVLDLIGSGAWRLPGADLRAEAAYLGLDDRTALVLAPLAYVDRYLPMFVALEQVPTVLPVWEAVGEVLRGLGYSVAVGVLSAERYGVPQTRKRAILVARRDGLEAALPTPTHSAYYSRDPNRLDEGVLPWVSMAEALGRRDIPDGFALHFAGAGASAETTARQRQRPVTEPAHTITGGRSATFTLRPEVVAWAQSDRPSTVIQGDPRVPLRKHHSTESPQMDGALRLTVEEAAVLQAYPADFPFQGRQGKRFLQIGNAVPPLLAAAILRQFLAADETLETRVVDHNLPSGDAKARVASHGEGAWKLTVTDSMGRVVWADNSGVGGWASLVEQGRQVVSLVRREERLGRQLSLWNELVESAAAVL